MFREIGAHNSRHSWEPVTVETRIGDGRVLYLSTANEEIHWTLRIRESRDNVRRLIEALESALDEPND